MESALPRLVSALRSRVRPDGEGDSQDPQRKDDGSDHAPILPLGSDTGGHMTAARVILRATCAFHAGRLIGHALHYRYVTTKEN